MWSFIVTCSTNTVHYIIITNDLLSHGMCLPDNTKLSFIQSLITVTFSYGSLNLGQPISQPKTFFRHTVLDTLWKADRIPSSNSHLLGCAGFLWPQIGSLGPAWSSLPSFRLFVVRVWSRYRYCFICELTICSHCSLTTPSHYCFCCTCVWASEFHPPLVCVRKVIVFDEVLNS